MALSERPMPLSRRALTWLEEHPRTCVWWTAALGVVTGGQLLVYVYGEEFIPAPFLPLLTTWLLIFILAPLMVALYGRLRREIASENAALIRQSFIEGRAWGQQRGGYHQAPRIQVVPVPEPAPAAYGRARAQRAQPESWDDEPTGLLPLSDYGIYPPDFPADPDAPAGPVAVS